MGAISLVPGARFEKPLVLSKCVPLIGRIFPVTNQLTLLSLKTDEIINFRVKIDSIYSVMTTINKHP